MNDSSFWSTSVELDSDAPTLLGNGDIAREQTEPEGLETLPNATEQMETHPNPTLEGTTGVQAAESMSHSLPVTATQNGGLQSHLEVAELDEGWQEAGSRGRFSGAGRRRMENQRPSPLPPPQKGNFVSNNHRRQKRVDNSERGGEFKPNSNPAKGVGQNNDHHHSQPNSATNLSSLSGRNTRGGGHVNSIRDSPAKKPLTSADGVAPPPPPPNAAAAKSLPAAPQIAYDRTESKKDAENNNSDHQHVSSPECNSQIVSSNPQPAPSAPSVSKIASFAKAGFTYKDITLSPPGCIPMRQSSLELSTIPGPAPTVSEEVTEETGMTRETATAVDLPSEREDLENADVPITVSETSPIVEPVVEVEKRVEAHVDAPIGDDGPVDVVIGEAVAGGSGETSEGGPEELTDEAEQGQVAAEGDDVQTRVSEETCGSEEGQEDSNYKQEVPSEHSNDKSESDETESERAERANAVRLKKLSAAAPPFNPNSVAAVPKVSIVKAIAVTPFKDGKAPTMNEFPPHVVHPHKIHAAVAVTPIRMVQHPPLAPFPTMYDVECGLQLGHSQIQQIQPVLQTLDSTSFVHKLRPLQQPSPKRMNPDAEVFIPSYLRDSPSQHDQPSVPSPVPQATTTEPAVADSATSPTAAGPASPVKSENGHLEVENGMCVDSSSQEGEATHPTTEIESENRESPSFVPLQPCSKDEGEVADIGTD